MKKITKIFLSTILSIATFGHINIQIKAYNDDELRNNFLDNGVDIGKVDVLIEKVENGELLDSMNPDAEPINVRINETYGSIVTTYEYQDGSTMQVSIVPYANINLNGIVENGNKSSGPGWYSWTNAEVKATWGVINCYFHADMNGGYGSSKITKVYNYGITVMGGTFSNENLSIVTQNADSYSGTIAEAVLSFRATATQNFGDTTVKLHLYVTGSGNATAKLTN